MRERVLGQQGLKVSELGYGAMGISMAYGPSEVKEGIATIRRAVSRSCAGTARATKRDRTERHVHRVI